MREFYGQVKGNTQTIASRIGYRDIRVSAQSYDGSVITRLYYDADGELQINIQLSDDSSFYGQSYFTGTLKELKEQLNLRKGDC